MKENNPIKRCSRNGCDNHGINKVNGKGSTWYCDKHFRFRCMRNRAQQRGKTVPSWEQLDEMLLECLNEHGELGACPSCGQQMQWRAGADNKRGSTISLQHNHDTTECMVCQSCNVGHGHSRIGDRYLEPTPVGFKHCGDCDTVKPLDQFNKSRRSRSGTTSNCRECQSNRCRKRYHAKKAAKKIANIQQELAI